MALAFTKWQATFRLIDQGGNESHQTVDLVGASDALIAAILTNVDTLYTRLLGVTDCVVKSVFVTYVMEDAAVSYGTGEAENVALIVADIDDVMDKTVNIRVPAPKDAIFKGAAGKDFNTVDTADAAVIAYLSSFETGGLATVSDGETIKDSATVGNWFGKRIHRGSRRG